MESNLKLSQCIEIFEIADSEAQAISGGSNYYEELSYGTEFNISFGGYLTKDSFGAYMNQKTSGYNIKKQTNS